MTEGWTEYGGPDSTIAETVYSYEGGGGYEWDDVVVLRRLADGKLFMGAGAGCSCNSFWMDYGSWDDMVQINSVDSVLSALGEVYPAPSPTEVVKAMSVVDKALRR